MEEWNEPAIIEKAVGLEINSYACAVMADDDNGDNGDDSDDKSDDSDDKSESDQSDQTEFDLARYARSDETYIKAEAAGIISSDKPYTDYKLD